MNILTSSAGCLSSPSLLQELQTTNWAKSPPFPSHTFSPRPSRGGAESSLQCDSVTVWQCDSVTVPLWHWGRGSLGRRDDLRIRLSTASYQDIARCGHFIWWTNGFSRNDHVREKCCRECLFSTLKIDIKTCNSIDFLLREKNKVKNKEIGALKS